MTNIRRYWNDNNTCFPTHVTYNRCPILIDNFDLLWQAITKIKDKHQFELIAWVIMPDHCHFLISCGANNPSNLTRQIKLSFSTSYRGATRQRTGRVWQYRFWDHIIRDQNDMNRHIDYIHYNPVKHGIVDAALKYQFSSFREYSDQGIYQDDWGKKDLPFEGEFGE